jgi:Na+-translocating ferredoxin:NAD+ oxidoreductase RnfD subunit
LFTFFMISDPKTTPDSRPGRILFALLVAAVAAFVQFGLYGTNGLLWSLTLVSMLTPAIDCLLPGTKYRWDSLINSVSQKPYSHEENRLISRPAARPVG